eukprot:TRINITY_DN64991_c0_g1_i2.p3 TRINITY_DN64991_c0_g1~~TRINITY_DN64991_c0_g1_i2.p3  ORF type:complete len:119 (+),score=19.73 TRINITY_DN64991_c0_g1_i2:34-390(+)
MEECGTDTAFQVFVRVRPLAATEKISETPKKSLKIEGEAITIQDQDMLSDYGRKKEFVYDDVFDEEMKNYEVYHGSVGRLIEPLFQGYNATCFAYGMTGAGKTHTMFGDIYKLSLIHI